MIPLKLSEIAAVTGAQLHGPDQLIDGPVVTDSREAAAGSLYVARIGEFADGHDYAPAAAAAGAVATLGSRPVDGMSTLVADDVQEAFAKLAREVIERADRLRVIGITGSSGKTTTKDLLAQVLATAGETIAPVGSLNSEVGVPLTVCRVTEDTDFLVAEMGASGVGHIAYLTRIAPPTIGIVLNVGSAHLGEFGSVDAIARTKSELVQALPESGLAILNADDVRVSAMAQQTKARVIRVGQAPDADVRCEDVVLDKSGRARFTIVGLAGEGPVPVSLQLYGAHQVGNALAVAVAAHELGLTGDAIARALESARPVSRWRMEVHQLPTGVTLVNDAYNANPDSMKAALRALAQMAGGRRTVAVLGEMLELGDESEAAHRGVGEAAASLGVTELVAVGAGAAPIAAAAALGGVRVHQVTDVEQAHDLLSDLLVSGDVMLLKSSRDSGLRYLGDRITVEQGGEITQ